ncbi:MAG TPA: prepilin-type N-terminal cleavage/methylation domain-containing protein [Candidatus Acidoferrum sp.]|jgi:prepilin-type N-terminal cleavage/methylation domain-containing protein|nr:prepilin-type N-terminal cleavage/methylation domain-containing protein [Candidatus Acidoferrum sp.]
MSIRPALYVTRAWTLIEMMVAVAVFSIVAAALGTIFMFSLRSYAAMANYALLDQYDRQAMDLVTKEIRQAQSFVDYTSNATTRALIITNGDGVQVTYAFDSSKQRVTRAGTDGSFKILLTNCNLLSFNLFMRPPAPPTNSLFDGYPPVIASGSGWQKTVKVIQLSWKTSMSICPTPIVNSEDIQTACIVIRKQQD